MKCRCMSSKRGFTLAELLVTIAIIGVLSSLAVVGVVKARNNLEMAELNSYAREIFLVSQNTLTAEKAAGTNSAHGENSSGTDEYWLFGTDISYLVPSGALESEMMSGCAAIRYNAVSCVVEEVYYSRFELPHDGVINNEYLQESSRRKAKIGYYNGLGDSGDEYAEIVQLLAPKLILENGSELVLKVKVPTYDKHKNILISIETEGVSSGTVTSFETTYDKVNGEFVIVLDSLNEEEHFAQLFENYFPGENIKITATLSSPNTEKVTYLPAKASVTGNSLFASCSDKSVYISNSRHLQNLEKSVSGCMLSGISVFQLEQIIWPQDKMFVPITSVDGYITLFDGASLGVEFLNNPLFDSVSGVRLKNIHIINSDIVTSGTAGTLACYSGYSDITGCMAYLDGSDNYGAYGLTGNIVGGLIGEAEGGQLVNCAAALYSLAGTISGGLVGEAENISIHNCYASFENLVGTECSGGLLGDSASSCRVYGSYAVGNIASSTGTVCGFDCGDAAVKSSYCAVSYYTNIIDHTELQPTYGFSRGADTSCMFWNSRKPLNSCSAHALNYSQLISWTMADGTPPASSHPYREMGTDSYPFAGAKILNSDYTMPHYGSWPVERADSIVLTDEYLNLRTYALVPVNSTAFIYAIAYENNETAFCRIDSATPAASSVIDEDRTILKAASLGSYNSDTGATTVILNGGNTPGVTEVELKAGDIKLRMVVVVYDVEIQLELKGGGNALEHIGAVTSKTGPGKATLENARKSIDARAEIIMLQPSKSAVQVAVSNLGPGVSAEIEDFENWDQLVYGDPAVVANGEPEKGIFHFEPVNGDYYFNSITDGYNDKKLTVNGASSGTGTIAARWAPAPGERASYDIEVCGARVLIEKSEEPNLGVSKENYPYRIDLIAEPGQTVNLKFYPKVFGASKQGNITKIYKWNVFRIENNAIVPLEENIVFDEQVDSEGVYSFKMLDDRSYSEYIVSVEYEEYNDEELIGRSLDYTTFSVYKRALAGSTGEYLSIVQTGGWLNNNSFTQLSGTSLWLEQIESDSYQGVNEATLQSWVEGAGNTKTIWQFSTDLENWTDVTGHLGSLPIYDASGLMRATVRWNNHDQLFNENETGGSITVNGLDADIYGEDSFVFYLRSSAAEATVNGEYTMHSRIITVNVLPKMELKIKTRVELSLGSLSSSYTFSCNRTTKHTPYYGYSWYVNGEYISDNNTPQCRLRYNSSEQIVNVFFGPHTDNGVLKYVEAFGESKEHYTVNMDYTKGNDDHIVIEINRPDMVYLSWKRLEGLTARVKEAPTSTDYFAIVRDETANNSNSATSDGTVAYIVNGNKFTYDTPIAARWILDRNWFAGDTSKTAYIHVAGINVLIDNDGTFTDANSGVVVKGINQSVKLFADVSFPADFKNSDSVVWTTNNPELISFKDGICEGKNVEIIANKYSSLDYSAVITATYTVIDSNGKQIEYQHNVYVTVPPTAEENWRLDPCGAVDIPELQLLWPEDEITNFTNLAFSHYGAPEGSYTLVNDPALNMNRMYLKVTGAAIDDYFWSINNDWLRLNADTKLSSDGSALYIRLSPNDVSMEMHKCVFDVYIGNSSLNADIYVCEMPRISIYKAHDNTVLTNESIAVSSVLSDYSVELRAEIYPEVYPVGGVQQGGVVWHLVAAEGYDANEYLSLLENSDGTVTVKVISPGRVPDFRIVVSAHSKLGGQANSGFAIVFLPEDK